MGDVKYVPFFASFDNVARRLSDEQRLRLYDAVCDYGFRGIWPDLSDDLMLLNIFEVVAPNIETTVKKMMGGKKGGRPKKTGNDV